MSSGASLSSLPVELISMIAGYVHPDDIVALACTCKDVKSICEARLSEHRGLLVRYGAVTVGKLSPASHRSGVQSLAYDSPADLLRAIEEDPWVAAYVHSITYEEEDWDDAKEYDDYPDDVTQYSEELSIGSFVTLIEELPLLRGDRDLRMTCKEYIVQGNRHTTMLVVLACTENLQHLTTGDDIHPIEWIKSAIRQGSTCFRNIRSVRIRSSQPYHGDCEPTITEWLELPALQHLSIDDLCRCGCADTFCGSPASSSPASLSSLEMNDCDVSGCAISQFLGHVIGLSRFAYTDMSGHADGHVSDPHNMVEGLMACASGTLETLHIGTDALTIEEPVILCGFTKLREFKGRLALLPWQLEEDVREIIVDLALCLPVSIEILDLVTDDIWVDLDGYDGSDDEYMTPTPKLLLRFKNVTRLPNLKTVNMTEGRLSVLTGTELAAANVAVMIAALNTDPSPRPAIA